MTDTKRTWIFPPTLKQAKLQFEALYRSLYKTADRRKPLMIVGDRGVGKSAFVDLFRRMYLDDNKGKEEERINIASYPGPLVAAELFGSVPGAFTGALNRKGYFETLGDGGLLILEEIGDISEEVQAQLLTVIEDGEFRRLGETKKREAKNIQIICTTNKPRSAFREDFYDRFFRFTIPSIYQRRQDILYYIGYFYPEILNQLYNIEVLSLMGFHWPGNVREIENVCELIKWRKQIIIDSFQAKENSSNIMPVVGDLLNPFAYSPPPLGKMLFPNEYGKPLSKERQKQLDMSLEQWELTSKRLRLTNTETELQLWPQYDWFELVKDAELTRIDKRLKKYFMSIGIGEYLKETYFDSIKKKHVLPKDIRATVINGENISAFDFACMGLYEYCDATNQESTTNNNLLIVPDDLNESKKTEEDIAEVDIFSMKEADLLRMYYRGLVDRHGNVSAAARWLGINRNTLVSRMKRIAEIS